MTDPTGEPVSGDEVRGLEARSDARFQAVNARFIAVDGRFAQLNDRINDILQKLQALDRSSEARCDAIDRRIDATRTNLEHVQAQLSGQIDHAYLDLRRIVILGLLGTTISTAMLCLGTIVLAL